MLDLADEPLDSREVQFLLSTPENDGGQWDMAVNLIEKYGLVPQSSAFAIPFPYTPVLIPRACSFPRIGKLLRHCQARQPSHFKASRVHDRASRTPRSCDEVARRGRGQVVLAEEDYCGAECTQEEGGAGASLR